MQPQLMIDNAAVGVDDNLGTCNLLYDNEGIAARDCPTSLVASGVVMRSGVMQSKETKSSAPATAWAGQMVGGAGPFCTWRESCGNWQIPTRSMLSPCLFLRSCRLFAVCGAFFWWPARLVGWKSVALCPHFNHVAQLSRQTASLATVRRLPSLANGLVVSPPNRHSS